MAKGAFSGGFTPRVTKLPPKGPPVVIIEEPPPAPPPDKETVKGAAPPVVIDQATSTWRQAYLERPGPSTAGMVPVAQQYVEQHPASVKEISGRYYRPIVHEDQMGGRPRHEVEAEILQQIESGEVAFGGMGQGKAGWTEERALRKALEVLEPYATRRGDSYVYDVIAIALSDDTAVKKAARKVFPGLKLSEIRQGFETIREQNPELYQILTDKGYNAYKRAYDRAIDALKPYETAGGYDIVTLAMSGDLVAKKAAAFILPGVDRASLNELRAEFKDSTRLPDGTWMTKEDVESVKDNHPELYRILTKEGGGAYEKAAKAQETATKAALTRLKKYKAEEGYNILAAVKDGVSKQTLEDAGFDDEAINWAFDAQRAAKETGIALPGDKNWLNLRTGEVISNQEYNRITKKGTSILADEYVREPSEAKRMIVEGMTYLFVPSKALLPEVKLKDVSTLDWAIGGAQIAILAVPFISAARGAGAAARAIRYGTSGAVGGVFTGTTIVHWKDLTPAQRAMAVAVDVLVLLPFLDFVVGKPRISSVKVTTPSGKEVPIWSGLSVRGRPVIGKSGGQIILGSRGIQYPQLSELRLAGAHGVTYEPGVSRIEANIMSSRRAMEEMGFTQAEIAKVKETLAQARGFRGSPFLERQAPLPSIRYLNARSTAAVFDEAAALGKKLDRIYGSSTLEPQLKAELLRYWREGLGRKPADIDISVSMTAEEMERYIKEVLLPRLRITEGAGRARISKTSPALIEVKGPDGRWHHAVDIHSPTEPGAYGSPVAAEGAYGFEFARPAVKVKYNIGNTQYELRLMRIDETGLRKMASILEWRRAGGRGAPPEVKVTPAAHRVKDIADFYIIVWNLQGKAAADKWAAAYGFTTQTQLDELIKRAMADPPRFTGWEWSPTGKVPASPGRAPTIQIVLPPSLSAALRSKSPSFSRAITSPISPYSPASVSMGPSIKVSPSPRPSVKPSAGVSKPSAQASASSAASGKVASKKPSGSLSPKPSTSPSTSPAVSRSPSPASSPASSVSPSLSPASKPATSPLPSPYVYPYPVPTPGPSPSTLPGKDTKAMKRKRQEFAGAICFRQGALGRPPKPLWYAVKPPYSRQEDVGKFLGEPPPNAQAVKGGVESALRSIQSITGKSPERLAIDLGVMDILISSPSKKPGKPGAIKYRRDVKQKTTGDITIGPRRPKVTKGTTEETVSFRPPVSSKMPAAVAAAIGSYKGKVTPEGKVIVKVKRL